MRKVTLELTKDTANLMEIAIEVCAAMDVRLSELFSRSRVERIAIARHLVCYLARRLSCPSIADPSKIQITQQAIGQWIGRDHASVCLGEQRIKDRMSVDKPFASLVEQIKLRAEARLQEKPTHEQ